MDEKAFSFLEMPVRSRKPRTNGMTMCLDQGMGLSYTEDLLSLCSEYVDLWKLGWATSQLQSSKLVKEKIKLLRSHNISVCNGGTLLELSEHQGKAEILFDELSSDDPQLIIKECFSTIKKKLLKDQIKQARIQIRELESSGKDTKEIIIQVTKLQKTLQELTENIETE